MTVGLWSAVGGFGRTRDRCSADSGLACEGGLLRLPRGVEWMWFGVMAWVVAVSASGGPASPQRLG